MKGKSIIITLLVILAAFGSLTAQSKKDRDRARQLQQEADRAYNQKNFREAADKYGQALAILPNDSAAHYRKGFAHFQLKEYDAALTEFNAALSQGFKPLEIYKVRAFIYNEQKNYDAALADIQKGLALSPNDVQLVVGLGDVYLAKNDNANALIALQKAQSVAPNNADIDYNIARVEMAMGDAAAQRTAASKALAKGTRFVGETHYLLADACFKQGDEACSIENYQKAVTAKPDLYDAYRNLGAIYRSEGKYTDAINILRQGVKAFPNDGGFYTDLSWYYSLADRPDDAVAAGKAAVQLSPNQYLGFTNLCRAYNETKAYELALTTCNSALRLQPGDGETYFYMARASDGLRRSAEATRYYSLAVKGLIEFTKANPTYSDSWYLLGNAYFADNQRDKAVDAYKKALDLSPNFPKARFNLGVTYTRMKNKTGAQQQYDALRAQDPKLADLLKAEIDKM
ncbi:MAG: tetratricopeptide repeat protein [Acidobacteria bacterium]|nr:tetratricopeptide repeat protein [Acidobacteriota bacterium]